MSTRDDDALDALIDRVAHDLTAGNPPAALAAAVRSRIGDGDRGWPFVGWRPMTAVGSLVLAIGLATALWLGRPADAPSVANNRPVAATDGPAEAGPYAREKERAPSPTGADVVPRSIQPVVPSVAAVPLPGIEPLDVPAIDDPAMVAEMSPAGSPIEIEPLQIAPLELQ